MSSRFYSISEFSRMSGLSVKALRLYDEKALLVPAWVDPTTRYRYYTADQLRHAELIALLRAVEMSLTDIRDLLNSGEGARLNKLMTHRVFMQNKSERQLQTLLYIEKLLKGERRMTYEITVRGVSQRTLLSTMVSTSPDSVSRELTAAYGRLFGYLQEMDVEPLDAPMAVYHRCDDERWDVEACVPVAEDAQGNDEIYKRDMPACHAVVTVHRGPYEGLGAAYQAVLSCLDENGHKASGPAFDRYLNDPQVVDPHDLLTEIVWPIDRDSIPPAAAADD
jgi:DNA-binding transcriptional MerR regulator